MPSASPSSPSASHRAARRKPVASVAEPRRRSSRPRQSPPPDQPSPPLWKKIWRVIDKPPPDAEAWALAHYRGMFPGMSEKRVLGACRYDMRRAFRSEREGRKFGKDPSPLAERQANQIIVHMIKRVRRQMAEDDLADPEAAARRMREAREEQERRRAAAGVDPNTLSRAPGLAA